MMRGDFSRLNGKRAREQHYSGVLWQQGRVQLDADYNEQQSIERYRAETTATDMIGPSGTPKGENGFAITVAAGTLNIDAGRFYVDGILCENNGAVRYADQPYVPDPASIRDRLREADSAFGLVYLDVWERHITALDDDLIREKALGGPDTTTRTQVIWQVKVQPLASAGVASNALPERLRNLLRQRREIETRLDSATGEQAAELRDRLRETQRGIINAAADNGLRCRDMDLAEWNTITAASDERLTARAQPVDSTDEACLLPESAGYRGLENQLYRVEIHLNGERDDATFKWSRDNGAVVARIEAVDVDKLIVSELGRDAMRSFAPGQWVEIVTDADELGSFPGQLVQIEAVDTATRTITLEHVPAAFEMSQNPVLRRWDQSGSGATNTGIALSDDWITLEDGVQVRFDAGTYHSGSYWVIPARTVTGDIEWPPYDPDADPLPQPPLGIEHHYAPLAFIGLDENTLHLLVDCRPTLPTLTAIDATDIAFESINCAPELETAQNVQQALDILCRRDVNGCTVTAVPGADWERIFDAIQPGEDATVCFQVGTYELPQTRIVEGKGHLTITGAGPGTQIIARNNEAALHFINCAGVTIRDLSVRSYVIGRQVGEHVVHSPHLNGALTFSGCEQVALDSLEVECAAGGHRAATCVTIRDRVPGNTGDAPNVHARVKHCHFRIGHSQVGLLLINVTRATVEDNYLKATRKPDHMTLDNLLADPVYRSAVQRLLVTAASDREPADANSLHTLGVTLIVQGDDVIWFKTNTQVRDTLRNILAEQARRTSHPLNTIHQQIAFINTVAEDIVLNRGSIRSRHAPLQGWYRSLDENHWAVAAQGIVVGGQVARDIRIRDNTVEDSLQGIHVGVSHATDNPEDRDRAGTILIKDNTVILRRAPIAIVNRIGIFVGNSESLVIDSNRIEVRGRDSGNYTPIDGIRVHGVWGVRMIVSQNEASFGMSGGHHIYAQPLRQGFMPSSRWSIIDNAAEIIRVEGTLTNRVRVANNADNFALG